MGKIPDQLYQEKTETVFRCSACKKNYRLAVGRVCRQPENPHPDPLSGGEGDIHPYLYFAVCPDCGRDIPEAPHIKNLEKAWLNITGTKSPDISAGNLPAPGGAQRFNALKSGLHAKVATYFPAKSKNKDRYPECADCEHSGECEDSGVCLEISKVKMLVAYAFDSKNPDILRPLFQNMQADVFVLIKRILLQVCKDGVSLETPVFTSHPQSGYVMVEDDDKNPVVNISAHPLLKQLATLLQSNGMSLADLNMTPKSAGEQSGDMGNLKDVGDRKSFGEYQEERKGMIERFFDGVKGIKEKRDRDEVFKDAGR